MTANHTKHLSLIGYGIIPDDDLTLAAMRALMESDLIAVIANPWICAFLKRYKLQYEDIGFLYAQGRPRDQIYEDIAFFVASKFSNCDNLSYLTYGDPLLFETVSTLLIDQANEKNISVTIYPGIDFLNKCLAHIGLNIDSSLQVIEATSFLTQQIQHDHRFPLFLAQVGVVNLKSAPTAAIPNSKHFQTLCNHLLEIYDSDTPIVLLDSDPDTAAILSCTVELIELEKMTPYLSPRSSVYIGPLGSF